MSPRFFFQPSDRIVYRNDRRIQSVEALKLTAAFIFSLHRLKNIRLKRS